MPPTNDGGRCRRSAATRMRSRTPSWRSTSGSVLADSTRASLRKMSRSVPPSSPPASSLRLRQRRRRRPKRKKKKRQKRGTVTIAFKRLKKGGHHGPAYLCPRLAPSSRKQRRQQKVPVPAMYHKVDCFVLPQREMQDT